MSTPVSSPDAPAASSRLAAAPARALKLVVLVPCLNEERTVAEVVGAVPSELPGVASVEVVVLDDGSTDETAEHARAAGARVVSHRTNRGLGRTFRDGIRQALALGADLVVNIDGDGQFNPADIATLVAPIVAGEAHMVTASRFLDRKLVPRMPAIKRWGNRWVARIVWLLSGRRFRDVSCGFRAFSREALLRMNLFGSFTYTQETFLDLIFKGLEIVELPVKVEGVRRYGSSRIASSIPRYAFRSLQIMLRAFISYRPFSFFALLAGLFLAIGASLLGFLLAHYLDSGAFSPHIWAGFVGGSFCFLATGTMVIALVGDMLVRQRLNQEEVLYFLKRDLYRRGGPAAG
jgi:glycosyltransferase involved in cell wall biosynthesis